MTLSELNSLLITNLTRVGSNRITGPEILAATQAIVSYFATQISDIIPDWASGLTFQTDGSDNGKYCTHPDSTGKKRIWETKTDDNIGHEPPTNPITTEDTYWLEVSASAGSSIQEWSAGVYGPGLVIVFHNHSVDGRGLYVLLEPIRPFTSSNIETEISGGQWEMISGGSGSGGGPAIDEKYANIAAMLADQVAQTEDALYFVADASTDATVDSGWALYQKLAATTASLTDYRKLSEEESLDVIFSQPDASPSVKGIAKLYSDLSSSNTDGSVTQAGVKTASDLKKDIANTSPTVVTVSGTLTINSVVGDLLTLDCGGRDESKFHLVIASTNISIRYTNMPVGALAILTFEVITAGNKNIRFEDKASLQNGRQSINDGKDAMVITGSATRINGIIAALKATQTGAENNASSPATTNEVVLIKFTENT